MGQQQHHHQHHHQYHLPGLSASDEQQVPVDKRRQIGKAGFAYGQGFDYVGFSTECLALQ